MKLVVGLGNPGSKYAKTRHNVGFSVLAELARRFGSGRPKARFQGETVDAVIAGQPVLLLCPHTYMNSSGLSVQPAMAFYKIAIEDLLVVCDDFSISLGKLRFRAKGSSGGQKGLQDIIQRLGTEDFSRLRVGIGPTPEFMDAVDFVLSRFTAEESAIVEQVVARAADGVAHWVEKGIQSCMNHFNAG